MTSRYDVSEVPPQSASVAQRCPVRIQNDVLRPAPPRPAAEEVRLRRQQGVEFERQIFAQLRRLQRPRWLFVDADEDRQAAVAATVAAMEDGAELIAGGWLPVDDSCRRTGRPDLLLRCGGGYVPVDVKNHLTLDVDGGAVAEVSSLDRPAPEAAVARPGWARRKRKRDALQLAHYRRMLEAIGFAADSGRAGILGVEKLVVWYRLDEPLWRTPAKSDGRRQKTRTTMEVYDFEFGFRLDIAAVALRWLADPSVALLVEPMRCAECGDCPWRDHCDETLTAGSGDPSLLPGIAYRPWRALRDAGITDRAGVAALDYPTATLAAAGVRLDRLWARARSEAVETPLAALIPRAKKQLAALRSHHIVSVGDLLAAVDPTTAELAGGSYLSGAILNARAALGDSPVYRFPGRSGDAVPRAGLEIDVDMENTQDGTYLWGALVSDRADTGLVGSGYRPFVTWEPVDESAELAVFRGFWRWLSAVLAAAGSCGASVKVYCWHESAESTQMRRIAAADPRLADEVQAFIGSDAWTDLEKVFRASWLTGESTSLKHVAPLAGFEWPVDDPGGARSIVRHREATTGTPEQTRSARRWLLDYNRGDVEATLRIREWLDSEGTGWPEVPTG